MIALFQCCGPPFFGIAKTRCGDFCGFGYRIDSPIILRVRCPSCSRLSEMRLDAPSIITHVSRAARRGIHNLRITQGIRLLPLQLSPGRLTEVPAEFCDPPRAWELSLSLAASAAASGLTERDQPPSSCPTYCDLCSTQQFSDSAAQHHQLALLSQAESTCDWRYVKMKWKRTPAIDGRI